MKKRYLILFIILTITLYGCTNNEINTVQDTNTEQIDEQNTQNNNQIMEEKQNEADMSIPTKDYSKPGRVLPKCFFSDDFPCLDALARSTNISLALRNDLDSTIRIESVEIENCLGDALIGVGINDPWTDINFDEVPPNELLKIRFLRCNNGENGRHIEAEMTIQYTNLDTGSKETIEGNIISNTV